MWNPASDFESLSAVVTSVMSCDMSCDDFLKETTFREPRDVPYEERNSKDNGRDYQHGSYRIEGFGDNSEISNEKQNERKTMFSNHSENPETLLGIRNFEVNKIDGATGEDLIKSIFSDSLEDQPCEATKELTEEQRRAVEELASQIKRFRMFKIDERTERKNNQLRRKEYEEESQTGSLFSTGSSMNFLQNTSEEVDLEFAEKYDNAFNEFLRQHPEFLRNQELVQKVRIAKLQNILDTQEDEEASCISALNEISEAKRHMVRGWQNRLRAAAHDKAVRETHLQSYLGDIHYNTKTMEAQLTWQLIRDTEDQMKKIYLEPPEQRDEPNPNANFDRLELLKLLDGDDNFDAIRDAALAPGGEGLSSEQRKDLRQFETDNEFLLNELLLAREKVAQQKQAAKKQAWVGSALVRMDERSFKSLKQKFQKRAGVPVSS